MKKKLEDFAILKYAIDQLMVASLTDDNVYKLLEISDNPGTVYMVPTKGFYKNHTYIGFTKTRRVLFVVRTTSSLVPMVLFSALRDGTVGEEHSNDIKYYVEIDITDYTSTQLVRFVENREVELINTRRRDIKETWRRESLNAIANTGDKNISHSDTIK